MRSMYDEKGETVKLKKKVVLITGASSGIGEATAHLCAAKGAHLVLAARSADKLNALAEAIRARGGAALVVPTDVTHADQVRRMVDASLKHYGQVDVLINNAGYGVFDRFQEARFADLEGMMQVNLYGAVHCIQALLPHMIARKKRAQIVNVASIAGLVATNNQGFYNTTKFALVGMTRALQVDLRGTKVRCALICPGPVHTNFFTQADMEKLTRLSRLMPWLQADDVARAIVRAVACNSNGEAVLPARTRPLIALATVFPGFSRWLLRTFG